MGGIKKYCIRYNRGSKKNKKKDNKNERRTTIIKLFLLFY